MALAGAPVDLPPDDGRPLYRRLLAQLRSDIDAGRLRPGDVIPPELEIARGLEFHTRVVHRALRAATPVVASRLDRPVGAPVIEMELLRLVEGAPVSLEFSITPHDRFPTLLEADLTKQSLYDVMAAAHGV